MFVLFIRKVMEVQRPTYIACTLTEKCDRFDLEKLWVVKRNVLNGMPPQVRKRVAADNGNTLLRCYPVETGEIDGVVSCQIFGRAYNRTNTTSIFLNRNE